MPRGEQTLGMFNASTFFVFNDDSVARFLSDALCNGAGQHITASAWRIGHHNFDWAVGVSSLRLRPGGHCQGQRSRKSGTCLQPMAFGHFVMKSVVFHACLLYIIDGSLKVKFLLNRCYFNS